MLNFFLPAQFIGIDRLIMNKFSTEPVQLFWRILKNEKITQRTQFYPIKCLLSLMANLHAERKSDCLCLNPDPRQLTSWNLMNRSPLWQNCMPFTTSSVNCKAVKFEEICGDSLEKCTGIWTDLDGIYLRFSIIVL